MHIIHCVYNDFKICPCLYRLNMNPYRYFFIVFKLACAFAWQTTCAGNAPAARPEPESKTLTIHFFSKCIFISCWLKIIFLVYPDLDTGFVFIYWFVVDIFIINSTKYIKDVELAVWYICIATCKWFRIESLVSQVHISKLRGRYHLPYHTITIHSRIRISFNNAEK